MVFGVEAKYTFGNAVKGIVTIKIDTQSFSSEKYKINTFPIDGKTTVELDLTKDLGITESSYTQNKTLDITVLEELTGNSLICSLKFHIILMIFEFFRYHHVKNFLYTHICE
jgi:PKD repeat protein